MTLYRAERDTICAGWEESPDGRVLASALVLRRWLAGDASTRVARMRRAGFAVTVVPIADEVKS